MTTTKPELRTGKASRQWKPYPELEREPKDMQQAPPCDDLRAKLRAILTPGSHYPYHPTILIGSEIPIYYGATNPATNRTPYVIPDCLVAFDVDTAAIWARVGYDPIQNGKPPDLVIEVASRTTHRNDTLRKRGVYRQLLVPEYWRFDPTGGDYYGRPIIGERLVAGEYVEFPPIRYDDGAVGATSAILNLNFRWRAWRFRIHHPVTGGEYEHPQEANARMQAEQARMRAAQARMQVENDRLQAEIRRLRGER